MDVVALVQVHRPTRYLRWLRRGVVLTAYDGRVPNSHIETQLIAAIRKNLPSNTLLWDYTGSTSTAMFHDDLWFIEQDDPHFEPPRFGTEVDYPALMGLHSQVRIDSYCIDLVLESGGAMVFIECDGHDWHERTKQQAAYDRERDRSFLARGFVTVRFTGSEIVHYPEKCCAELFAVVATSRRIATALLRNGFLRDGSSYQSLPSQGVVRRTDGTEYIGHWNPGRQP